MATYFDRTGAPITVEECRVLLDRQEYRQVLVSHLADGRTLSTQWLGYDYRNLDAQRGPMPLCFESELFPDREVRRYVSEKEARAGHEAWLEELARQH